MKPMTCGLLLVAVCAGGISPAHAQSSSRSLEGRRAAQNALFEEEYEAELKAYPERATAYGDYRYNDRLNDYSLAGAASAQARDKAFLKRLQAIATTGFDEQDLVSHEVLVRTLEQHLEDHRFKEYEMPVSQVDGPHIHLADLPLAVPFDSAKQYEDYIARLHQIPRAFEQTEQVLRAGLRDQLMPVRFLLEKVRAQCEGVIAADPFVLPTHTFPSSIPAAEQQRLTRQITETAEREVLPAYRAFGQFIEREYAPHGRSVLSVTSLSDGEARYHNEIRSRTTVSTLTPDQIHEIGLREMTRIEAEMARHRSPAGLSGCRVLPRITAHQSEVSTGLFGADRR